MTAILFVTGTPVAWTGRDPLDAEASGPDLVHAVAKPVVDGLDSSVCGLLVTASAGAYNTSQGAEVDNARCVLRASDGSLNGGGGELGYSGRLGPLGLGTVFVQDSLSSTRPITT